MKIAQRIPQVVLGSALIYAGIGHLTTNRTEFQAQVPTILKSIADFVVLASGVVEIVLGLSLIFLWRYRVNGSSGLSTASYTVNLITQACFTQ
jgi:uncharacterized membrane protein